MVKAVQKDLGTMETGGIIDLDSLGQRGNSISTLQGAQGTHGKGGFDEECTVSSESAP